MPFRAISLQPRCHNERTTFTIPSVARAGRLALHDSAGGTPALYLSAPILDSFGFPFPFDSYVPDLGLCNRPRAHRRSGRNPPSGKCQKGRAHNFSRGAGCKRSKPQASLHGVFGGITLDPGWLYHLSKPPGSP